jgi:hypothetical protein
MSLTLAEAVRWLCALTALCLVVQCAESLRMIGGPTSLQPWPWRIQRDDLRTSPYWLRACFDFLFAPKIHRAHVALHGVTALSLFVMVPPPIVAAVLLLSQVVIQIRWRGAFNGGADFMTLVLLMGIALGAIATPWVGESLAWQAGLWLISIQTLSSYFLSGTVKLRYEGWRNGRALPALLSGALYGPLPAGSPFRRRAVAVIASWAFIIWEASFPLAMVHPAVTTAWCAIGVVFHFLVFWFFGLNRFFWAWIAAYPALIACSNLLQG